MFGDRETKRPGKELRLSVPLPRRRLQQLHRRRRRAGALVLHQDQRRWSAHRRRWQLGRMHQRLQKGHEEKAAQTPR